MNSPHYWAWITYKNRTFYARGSSNYPGSAVIKIIQGIFEEFVDHSFFILRQRIFTNEAENPVAKSIVKVAAKRVSFGVPIPNLLQNSELLSDWVEVLPKESGYLFVDSIHRDFLLEKKITESIHGGLGISDLNSEFIFALDNRNLSKNIDSKLVEEFLKKIILQIPRGGTLHDYNRPIAVAAFDKNNLMVDWAIAQNYKNKTLHAEVILASKILLRQIPIETVFCSLKPCKMCAALLNHLVKIGLIQSIRYFENDPGPLAQNTELDGRSYFIKESHFDRP